MSLPTNAELIRTLIAGRYDGDLVSMDLADAPGGEVSLEYIWSERTRRVGHASKALDALCEAADRLQVGLVLEAHWLAYETGEYPIGDAEGDRLDELNEMKLGNDDLAAWYGRRGFVEIGRVDHDNPLMRRKPVPSS